MTDYHTYAETVYQQLLNMEANASSEQLFTYSYLLGHISLISSAEGNTSEEFISSVEQSLEDAFKVDYLEDEDKADILSVWQQLNTAG
ncbi:YfcL family protein [Aliamphritea spongicola]|uniref:YfcL family protein n=1 Tax=Aliamphritea spongicola TaxID=707589 RepID=UPI00196A516A|nr:YfcL family protein [Aliamphritea spongicola]MBN3560673.1 YfcL family protein [Aliamphritea spongicola]